MIVITKQEERELFRDYPYHYYNIGKYKCLECNQIKEYTQDYDDLFEITWLGDGEKT